MATHMSTHTSEASVKTLLRVFKILRHTTERLCVHKNTCVQKYTCVHVNPTYNTALVSTHMCTQTQQTHTHVNHTNSTHAEHTNAKDREHKHKCKHAHIITSTTPFQR